MTNLLLKTCVNKYTNTSSNLKKNQGDISSAGQRSKFSKSKFSSRPQQHLKLPEKCLLWVRGTFKSSRVCTTETAMGKEIVEISFRIA